MLVMGIDLGTQHSKVIVYDPASKQVVAEAGAEHAFTALPDDTCELMPSWWIAALQDCMAALRVDAKAPVKAIRVSGQQYGLVEVV